MIFSPPGGWRLWGVIAGVVLAFSFFTWLWLDGKSAGIAQERAAWEAAAYAVGEAANNIAQEEGQSFHHDAGRLDASRETGRQEIEESGNEIRALLLAYARADQRLCGNASGPCADSGA